MFYPKEEYGSAYQVPFEELYNRGYRAIVFDIDNTLVPHGAPADERSIKLCRQLMEMGYQLFLLSNNGKKRVETFALDIGNVPAIYNAGKPFTKGYEMAAKRLGQPHDKILFIGDQLLTDVIGANRVGFYSILVGPVNRHEKFWIVWKRKLEAVGLFFYHHSKKFKGHRPNRKGYEENIPEQYR